MPNDHDTPGARLQPNAAGLRARADAYRATTRPAAAPPEERGERLATIARKEGEELRISWDAFEGRPYLSLRIWTGGDGGWWPTQKGVTIGARHLGELADAVLEAIDRAERVRR